MPPEICAGEPTDVVAGDAWRWRRSFADYPVSDGGALSYAIAHRGPSITQAPLAWDAAWVTDDGTEYTVVIPSAATADLAAGGWELTGYITLSGQRSTVVPRQPLRVHPNLATASAGSDVRHAEVLLGLVEAELMARYSGTAGSAHDSYQIGDRAINKMSVKELRMHRAALKAEVVQARGGQIGRTVEFTFGRPRSTRNAQWD